VIRSYEVTCPALGPEFSRVQNARTGGEARNLVRMDLRDLWPDVTFKHLKVKSLGAPRTSRELARVAAYRNRPELGHAGTRVIACGRSGVIADSDASANFIVLFDDGTRGHVHHGDIRVLPPFQYVVA
jgi:hypothetical protein